MKKIFILTIVLVILSGMGIAHDVNGASLDDYPKLNGYVNDFAGVLSDDEEFQLTKLIEQIERNTSVEIAVVTVLNTDGNARITYATELGEHNGIGKSSKDNGLVILWSLENEKGGAIATGRGIESILNDAKVTRIGRASRDYFDQGQYYLAFEFILNEVKIELDKAQKRGDQLATGVSSGDINLNVNKIIIILAILIFIIFIVGGIFSRGDNYSTSTRAKSTGYVPIIIPPIRSSGSSYKSSSSDDDDDDDDYSGRSSSYVGSSYSGGGFSGFGGGSFGGGGGAF